MGQLATAVFAHSLNPSKIVAISARLESEIHGPWGSSETGFDWSWTRVGFSEKDLVSIWSQKWPLARPWSEADLAILRGPGESCIHFSSPSILCYSDTLRWSDWRSPSHKSEKERFVKRCEYLSRCLGGRNAFLVLGESDRLDEMSDFSSIEQIQSQLRAEGVEHDFVGSISANPDH